MLAAVVGTALVTRLLDPTDAGTYFAVFAIVTFAALVGSLGVTMPLISLVGESAASGSRDSRAIVSRAAAVGGAGSVLAALLFFVGFDSVLGAVSASSQSIEWWIVAVTTTLFIFEGIAVESLRAHSDIRGASMVQITAAISTTAVLSAIWLSHATANVVAVLAAVAVGQATGLVAGSLLLGRQMDAPDPLRRPPTFGRFLAIGLPWLGTSLLVYATISAGVLVAAASSSAADAALYGTAFRLATLVGVPFAIAGAVLPPFIARLWPIGDRRGLENLMRGAATLTSTPALLGFALLLIGGRPLLSALFGTFYTDAYWPMVVLAAGFVADAVTGHASQMLVLVGYQRSVLLVFAIVAPASIAAMWVLGSSFGALGVAVGSTAGMVIANTAAAVVARRATGIGSWATWSIAVARSMFHATWVESQPPPDS